MILLKQKLIDVNARLKKGNFMVLLRQKRIDKHPRPKKGNLWNLKAKADR